MAKNNRKPDPEIETPEACDALATADDLSDFTFERDLSLADGQGFIGTFMGMGDPSPIADATGEIREVPVARFKVRNVVYRILCGSKLARLLLPMKEGDTLAVKRLGMVETRNGHRMTDYAVGRKETR